MGQLIRPDQVHIVTKNDGEIQITLTININVNGSGIATGDVAESTQAPMVIKPPQKQPDDDPAWVIPDFGTQKIEFGQKVQKEEK